MATIALNEMVNPPIPTLIKIAEMTPTHICPINSSKSNFFMMFNSIAFSFKASSYSASNLHLKFAFYTKPDTLPKNHDGATMIRVAVYLLGVALGCH